MSVTEDDSRRKYLVRSCHYSKSEKSLKIYKYLVRESVVLMWSAVPVCRIPSINHANYPGNSSTIDIQFTQRKGHVLLVFTKLLLYIL